MIMEWKRCPDGFRAAWRGQQLLLTRNPVNNRWHILADNMLVRQDWSSAERAMEDIDRRQTRLVLKAAQQIEVAHAVAHT